MSHFSVIVIGPDPERQLAPYHEFECTGRDDEFVQYIDVTEQARAEFAAMTEIETFAEYVAEYHGKSIVPHGQVPDLSGEHKYGYALLDENGEVVKVVDRTNPNKRWDWYEIGGRWTGFFPLKPHASGMVGCPGLMTNPAKPGTADQCAWGDVDVYRARAEAAAKAGVRFDKWNDIVALYGRPRSWEEMRDTDGNTDATRKAYYEQRAIQEMRAWDCPVAGYGFDRAAYIAKCVAKALVPFAVVKDGQWHERGKMGWWGCVSDEQDHDAWCAKVSELLDGLPPDTLVTMVDCHI